VCRDVLSNNELSNFLEKNFVLWGASVRSEEGFRLSHVLSATVFPLFGMMCYYNNSNITKQILSSLRYNVKFNRNGPNLIHKIQGKVQAEELVELLSFAINENEPLLAATRAERSGNQVIRSELSMQNEAFEESLRLDREKEERRKMEANKKLEEEERLKQELRAEELEREEQERKKQEQILLQQQLKLQKEKEKQQLLNQIPPEPEKGPNVVSLMIRFYNGRKMTRRFDLDRPINDLFCFVKSFEEIEDYCIGTHYPKVIFNDPNLTLREAQIPPQAVIYVDRTDL